MDIPNINFNLDAAVEDLASNLNEDMVCLSISCSIIEFDLPDGRRVQAQLVLQTDEFEFLED
jgi:hypothetical protein